MYSCFTNLHPNSLSGRVCQCTELEELKQQHNSAFDLLPSSLKVTSRKKVGINTATDIDINHIMRNFPNNGIFTPKMKKNRD